MAKARSADNGRRAAWRYGELLVVVFSKCFKEHMMSITNVKVSSSFC